MIVPFLNPGENGYDFLGIFAKEPVAGEVKTRLSPPLSFDQAAELYRLALHETVKRMIQAGFRPTLFFSGREDYFRRFFSGLPLLSQGDGDLGERLERALSGQLMAGFRKVVVIGSDSPDIPPGIIKKAFAFLAREEVVVSPALDGGYVLIGESRHHAELFRNIPWGSDQVLNKTRQRAKEKGLVLWELESWEDIDDAASLERFLRRSPASPVSIYVRRHLHFAKG